MIRDLKKNEKNFDMSRGQLLVSIFIYDKQYLKQYSIFKYDILKKDIM